jgi:hypothetical protein
MLHETVHNKGLRRQIAWIVYLSRHSKKLILTKMFGIVRKRRFVGSDKTEFKSKDVFVEQRLS